MNLLYFFGNTKLSNTLANRVKSLTSGTIKQSCFAVESMEEMVKLIVSINHAWKVASELFGETSPLSTSARDLKTALQVRLLRNYAPEQAYLVEDTEAEGEKVYSLRLRKPIDNRWYVEHLPIRVAKEVLSEEEIRRFSQS
ncbi:MAG TPA: hypothetical protein VK203_27915 [Nostocaceae cyanobacterium]|nr:hypothetical protein [Nostocaceae cyanobacterium]